MLRRSKVTMDQDKLLTSKQAAALLGVKHGTVLKYIKRGLLKVERWEELNTPNSPYGIRKSTVLAFKAPLPGRRPIHGKYAGQRNHKPKISKLDLKVERTLSDIELLGV